MSKEVAVKIAPENLEVANVYLETGDLFKTAQLLDISTDAVVEIVNKPEVKRYVDSVYMDLGYRNRDKLWNIMNRIIESKLEEAEDSEVYSNKDLFEIIEKVHKMRMEELREMHKREDAPRNQTNIQVNNEGNPFGSGNYGKLLEKLIESDDGQKH